MKKLFVMALAAFAMVACVNENITEIPNGGAISFENAFIDNATRAAEDPSFDNDNLSGFNVWGYVENTSGTVFTGTEVKNNNGVYTYEGTQYWAPEKNYYFAAVAGVAADKVTATDNVKPTAIEFTNEAGGQDLIYAYKEVKSLGAGQDNPAVELVFNHLLSKVKFSFTNGFPTSNVKVAVKDITMTAVKDATYNIENKAWENHDGEVTLAFGNNDGDYVATTATESANERLIIPTAGEQEYDIAFTIKVYQGDVEVNSVAKTSTISGVAFEQGKAYNLTAEITPETLGMDEIEFEVKVNDWEEGVVELPVDYLYDDKTKTYDVFTAEGLAQIAEGINNGTINTKGVTIKLNKNLDLAAADVQTRAEGEAVSNWTPIGNSTTPFKGTFDGNGYTISNLVINGGGNSNIGLFGQTVEGHIKNLVVENAKVSGYLNVGVVAGTPYTSKYSNITVKGHVEVDGFAYVGAVGGKNAYANWDNITVNVDETSYVNANSVDENGTAYRTYVGGVIGFMGEGGHKVSNVYSNINVKGSTCDVGGVAGIAHYGNTFENVTCDGNVEIYAAGEGDAQEIGGIAGVWNNGGAKVTFTNCKFNGTLTANVPFEIPVYGNLVCSAYSANASGILVIDGSEYKQTSNGVVILVKAVKTAEEFEAALEDENVVEIKLANDIETEGIQNVAAGRTLALNLNGYTLSTTDNTEKNFSLIDNRGTLTIKGEGKMTTKATINSGWGRYSAVVANNPGGNLTVEGGVVIEHLGGTDMAYGIDNLTNGKGTEAVTTIKDATIKSPYRAVRQFLNGVEAYNELYVEAGAVIEGANKSIWMHDPSAKANTGKLVVKEGAELNGDVYLFVTAGSTEWPVEVSIAASAVNGEVLTGNVPAGKAVRLVDGYYTVVDVTVVESNEALKDAVAAGGTLVLADGNYSMPSVTNGEVTISGTEDTVIKVTAETEFAGSNVTFDGVTLEFVGGDSNYRGLVRANEVTYNNATLKGQRCLYGNKEIFNNCTFELGTGEYVKVYGGNEVEFNICTFNTAGKAILIYKDGGWIDNKVSVKGCTFNATAGDKASAISNQNCAAIEIHNYMSNITLTTEGNTVDSDFSGEWRIKKYETSGGTVTVNDVDYTKTALDGKLMTVTGGVATMD